jgi:uncharacterized protein YheU (UPF0270 family)
MLIPHRLLTPVAVRAIVEEFVTRDGTDHSTDHSTVNQRIEQVLRQLGVGTAELHFDHVTATCNILRSNDGQNLPSGDGQG